MQTSGEILLLLLAPYLNKAESHPFCLNKRLVNDRQPKQVKAASLENYGYDDLSLHCRSDQGRPRTLLMAAISLAVENQFLSKRFARVLSAAL